jgi:hypothetical protein
VLPIFGGSGRRVTPEVDSGAGLTFVAAETWAAGVVELVYRMDGSADGT